MDGLVGEFLCDFMEEGNRVIIVFWSDVYGGEHRVVWLVGAEWLETFFVDDQGGDVFAEFCFFREDFMVLYC